MTLVRKARSTVVALALFAMVAALAVAPNTADAADHLDAPSLTSPGDNPRLDINDLYVFEGQNENNTVLAVTVNPLAAGNPRFDRWAEGAYHLRIDNNGDAVEDITYTFTFLRHPAPNKQFVLVRKATGQRATFNRPGGKLIGVGLTNGAVNLFGQQGELFAGLRSDPFFFDLGGFLGTVEGSGERMFNDGNESDFFAAANAMSIVIEVPDAALGEQINVWATTSTRNKGTAGSSQVDRMGRPAINTVVNSPGPVVGAPAQAKNVFNAGIPADDTATFTDAVIAALQAYSALDSEGAYTNAQASALAAVLLPDYISYDTSTAAAGPLNGRALADDVIDIELRIVTGGDPLDLFPGRDADGGINTDGVGPHTDYMTTFPYLGVPHS